MKLCPASLAVVAVLVTVAMSQHCSTKEQALAATDMTVCLANLRKKIRGYWGKLDCPTIKKLALECIDTVMLFSHGHCQNVRKLKEISF